MKKYHHKIPDDVVINPYIYAGLDKYTIHVQFANTYFGYDIRTESRHARYVLARNCLAKYLYDYMALTKMDIARILGLRNHATIIHNLRVIQRDIDNDRFRRDIWNDFKEKMSKKFGDGMSEDQI